MSTERVRTTYTDLLSWPEDGRRYELYDGEVSAVPAPLPRHQIAMQRLFICLDRYATETGGLVIASPIDIVFTEHNVLEPDIVVFTAARRHHVQLDQVIRVPPDVAVEVVSPSTAANDRGRKLRTFERFGVPEYWILDPHHDLMECRVLREGRYDTPSTARSGDTFSSIVLSGFSCDVGALFP